MQEIAISANKEMFCEIHPAMKIRQGKTLPAIWKA